MKALCKKNFFSIYICNIIAFDYNNINFDIEEQTIKNNGEIFQFRTNRFNNLLLRLL